jgi:serine/threonine protein kinase
LLAQDNFSLLRFCTMVFIGMDAPTLRADIAVAAISPKVVGGHAGAIYMQSRASRDPASSVPQRWLRAFDMDEDHKHIGGGSFAQVYRIKERSSKTPFALKIMNKPFFVTRGLGKQVDAEIEAMRRAARFGAQHVVHLLDSCEEADHVYMRMDLCQKDMFHLIQALPDGHLEDSDARTWTQQLCLGLKEIHQFGFLHRDIKPENLLIGFDGSLRIADFGWCAAIEDSPSTMAGTFHYMAPEVLAQTAVQTAAVDVWSGAVTMMQLCTGRMLLTTDLCTGLSATDPNEAHRRKVASLLAEIFRICPLAADARPSHMSPDCWGLLRHMLTPDVCQRASIDECLNHPWLLNTSSRRGHVGLSLEQIKATTRRYATKITNHNDDFAFAHGAARQDESGLSAPDSPSTTSTDSGKAMLEDMRLPACPIAIEQNVSNLRTGSFGIPSPSPSSLRVGVFRDSSSGNIPVLTQRHAEICEFAERHSREHTPRPVHRHVGESAERHSREHTPRPVHRHVGMRAEVLQPVAPRPPRPCRIVGAAPVADPASVPYSGEAGIDMLSRRGPNCMPVTPLTPSFNQTAHFGMPSLARPSLQRNFSELMSQPLHTPAPCLSSRVHHFAELMPTSPLLWAF